MPKRPLFGLLWSALQLLAPRPEDFVSRRLTDVGNPW